MLLAKSRLTVITDSVVVNTLDYVGKHAHSQVLGCHVGR